MINFSIELDHLEGLEAHQLILLKPRVLVRATINAFDQDRLILEQARHQLSHPQDILLVSKDRYQWCKEPSRITTMTMIIYSYCWGCWANKYSSFMHLVAVG